MMRVCIGIPTHGFFWWSKFSLALLHAVTELRCEWMVKLQTGPYLDTNREECVLAAVAHNCDRLLFLDYDMIFPPAAIRDILAHDYDVVGAAYNEKKLPLVSTVRIADGAGGFVVGV